jgi:hypothetical protein
MDLAPGARLGPYEVVGLLGRGGMGTVYRARDGRLGRDVALKILHGADPAQLQRLLDEARCTALVQHPNVLAVLDVGEHEGAPWLATELLEGEPLRARLGPGALPLPEMLELGQQIAHGLAAAHERDIVHGDLKPENVFVARGGHVKILDFGLAQWSAPAPETAQEETASLAEAETPALLGTAPYMSPEQIRREKLDARSDVFALGAVLYEMAIGRPAFRRATVAETLGAVLGEQPGGLESLPGPLREVLRRCLQKRPEERFTSARDVAFALDALRRGGAPSRASRVSRPALLVVAAVLALGLGLALLNRGPSGVPSYRTLTFRRGLVLGARFLDEQSVVYTAAWDGGLPAVYATRLDSVEPSRLDLTEGSRVLAARGGELLVRLPPGHGAVGAGLLVRMPVQGGAASRPIAEDVSDADAAPDAELALVRHRTGGDELEWPIGQVQYRTGGWIEGVRISPDGRRAAFVDHPRRGDTRGSVRIALRSGPGSALTPVLEDVSGLAWSSGGAEVWFTAAERGYTRALRAVDLRGRQRLVLQVPGSLELQDVSPGGRVLLTHWHLRVETRGRFPGESGERDLSWLDASSAADLSSDGRLLLFGEAGEGGGSRHSVYLRPTDGSPPVRLGDGVPAALSPDGRWAAASVAGRLVLLPTGPGEPRPLPRGSLESVHAAWWLPDGARLLLVGNEAGRPNRLFLQDIATGDPRPVAPEGAVAWSRSISPDGRLVAARGADGETRLFPLDGGDSRPLPGLLPGERVVQWSSDGSAVYVSGAQALGATRLFRVELASGRREPWLVLQPPDATGVTGLSTVLLTPDGRSYAYSYRRVLAELYVADGLP